MNIEDLPGNDVLLGGKDWLWDQTDPMNNATEEQRAIFRMKIAAFMTNALVLSERGKDLDTVDDKPIALYLTGYSSTPPRYSPEHNWTIHEKVALQK